MPDLIAKYYINKEVTLFDGEGIGEPTTTVFQHTKYLECISAEHALFKIRKLYGFHADHFREGGEENIYLVRRMEDDYGIENPLGEWDVCYVIHIDFYEKISRET